MSQVNTIPGLNFLFWSKSMPPKVTAVAVLSGVHNHGFLRLLGAQEIFCEWKEEWIPPNIKKLFKGHSRHWSWSEIEHSSKTIIQRRPRNISDLEVFCQEEWGKIPKARIKTLSRLHKVFTSCYSCQKGVTTSSNWQGSQTFAQGLFPFFIILKL